MGVVFSVVTLLRLALNELRDSAHKFSALKARIEADPGFPHPTPTRSFWMHPTADIPEQEKDVPEYADVVIIGSGITGASLARTIFGATWQREEANKLKVVVLEARDACGGATGRNGGHVKPNIYEEYPSLKRRFGATAAQKILQFRMAHIDDIIRVAEKEGVLEHTAARHVESIDAVTDNETFQEMKKRFEEWKADAPVQARGFTLYEARDAQEKFSLSDVCKGAVVGPAGALHPYRLVTAIWKRLLREHPQNFWLFTNTRCTGVSSSPSSQFYTVTTSRGTIATPHVVHATNAYAGHLLPQMRGKIFPVRATCTAQRPGQSASNSTQDGKRSWIFFHKHGYEYISQLPPKGDATGELIVGGGHMVAEEGIAEIGITDDSQILPIVKSYLGGVLPTFFGERNWGREGLVEDNEADWDMGRVKASWTGILCASADRNPWVGRIPTKIAGRIPPSPSSHTLNKTVAPGEWICAGYTGDGMSNALMSARALAFMILGQEDKRSVSGWFPEQLLITEERWRRADPAALMELL